jgi:hypothetical protein
MNSVTLLNDVTHSRFAHSSLRSAQSLLLDKKLSLFEKALASNPKDDELIADHLDLCRSKMNLAEVEAWCTKLSC